MTFKNIEEIEETEDTFIYYVNITSLRQLILNFG